MAKPIISISGTSSEREAFAELARRAYPKLKKGAQTALFRDWLYTAAKEANLDIADRTIYGDPSRFQRNHYCASIYRNGTVFVEQRTPRADETFWRLIENEELGIFVYFLQNDTGNQFYDEWSSRAIEEAFRLAEKDNLR